MCQPLECCRPRTASHIIANQTLMVMAMDNTTNKLLDRFAQVENLRSDYAIAKKLGIRASTVSGYRHGRSQLDSTTAMQIAERIGADPLEVLARIEIERAPTERIKTVWGKHVGRLLLAVALAFALQLASPVILQKSGYAQLHAATSSEYTLSAIILAVLILAFGVALSTTFVSGPSRVRPTPKGHGHATNQRPKTRVHPAHATSRNPLPEGS